MFHFEHYKKQFVELFFWEFGNNKSFKKLRGF
jgi:hypothetical protein